MGRKEMVTKIISLLEMVGYKYHDVISSGETWHIDTLLSIVCKHSELPYCNSLSESDRTNDIEQRIVMLKEELANIYLQLRELGLSKEDIRQDLEDRLLISRMVVASKRTLVFPDYAVKVRLTPLQWSLYILFLIHEEGFELKDIGDYRIELLELLCKEMNNSFRANDIVNRIIDTSNGALNENISRIRRSITDALPSLEQARHYFINGCRSGVFRIPIDRELVNIYGHSSACSQGRA